MTEKILSFTGLIAWQKAHLLAVSIYQETRLFPREEMYGLVSQIRRSALSVSSNLAEGFSRKSTDDKQRFYNIALGSLTELEAQLLLAKDLLFLDRDSFNTLADKSMETGKLINGLKRSLQSRINPKY